MHLHLRLLPMLSISVSIVVLLCTTALSADGVTDIPLAQVPKAILDTVKKQFPEAQVQSTSRGIDEGKPYYDVFIKVKAQNVWVTCDARGTLLVIDREITLKDLPKPVADALTKKYSKASIQLVNEITEGSHVSYDVELTHNQKKLIAFFEANGRFIEEVPNDGT
jgi:hypothetical protein